MSEDREILFELRGGVGFVLLNRPRALNALGLSLIEAFDARLEAWAADPAVKAVVVRGAGERAFCAGGDVRSIWEGGRTAGGPASDLFRREYMLIRRIKVLPKPYIALIDGIAMGGGVGVCVHGSHRVATERTLVALPETRIGLFPDVGSAHFLPRLPGALGLYLGLTGVRLKAADALYAGLADHYVESARLPELEAALAAADWSGGPAQAVASATIDLFAGNAFAGDPGAPALAERRAAVDRCFGQDSVAAILAALEAEGGDWAGKTLETLGACSPTSLKVTFEQLRRGAALGFDDAMIMEFRLSQAFLARHDFHEGIRAIVIDKDNAPKWRPDTLAEVTPDLVEAHFAPLGDSELTFG